MATGDTVAEKIADINASKAALIAAIEAKGVTMPEGAKLAELAEKVGEIESGTSVGYESFQDDPVFWNKSTFAGPIKWPEEVKAVPSGAFAGSSKLTSVTIPEGIISIGDSAFKQCSSLESVVVPDSVTTIGDSAFDECRNLTSLVIPEGVTEIGVNAFRQCMNLEGITFPKNLYSIRYGAFYNCKKLTVLNLSNLSQLQEIEESAFYGSGVTSIEFPSNLFTTIGDWAFAYCRDLKAVNIPHWVRRIGERAFFSCSDAESLIVDGGAGLPDCTIGSFAFSSCDNLKTIELSGRIAYIGQYAFQNSTGDVTFHKTKFDVSGMQNYPWGFKSGKVIHCTDGDLTVS